MVQVNITVNYEGKNYLTNVIAPKYTSEEEISRMAHQQVERQWRK
ncbi:BA3454 family stress response protein [Neobacillus terrae]|nr:BA3454 family stress response protein [Neobacillus terrae]NHM31106.1 BA3454 family stress response protein [Neobacillus terrae]